MIDTDIGPDCDDVAALAMLNIYANQELCKILGIGHCTSNPYGAGTIDAICRCYGHPDINISTYSGKDFLTSENCMRYNKYIMTHLENRYQFSQPEDAVQMYRRISAKKANLTFYRDKNGFEVDMIADWKHSFAMEIKSSSETEKKLSSNARQYVEMRQDGTKGQILYLGDVSCDINGVQYLSWKDWGK